MDAKWRSRTNRCRMADHGLSPTETLPSDGRRTPRSLIGAARRPHEPANRLLFREQWRTGLAHLSPDQQFAGPLPRPRWLQESQRHTRAPLATKLLQQVAVRLSGCLREGDTIARLAAAMNCDPAGKHQRTDDSIILATRISKQLVSVDLDGQQVVIGVSIGVTIAPTDAADPDHLLKNADMRAVPGQADGAELPFIEPEWMPSFRRDGVGD